MDVRIQGGFVVSFNGQQHEILDGGCVVYEDDRIIFVGFPDDPECPQADRIIDATGKLVSPGFVNLHCIANIDLQPLKIDSPIKGFPRSREWMESNEEVWTQDEFTTSARLSVAALLRHGSTTFCSVPTTATKRFGDPEAEPRALAQASIELGARAYLAHNFFDKPSYTNPDGSRGQLFDRNRGMKELEKAIKLVQDFENAGEDRVRGFIFPSATLSCSDELLKEASNAARQLKVPLRTHFAEYIEEHTLAMQESGVDSLVRLDKLGILGPEVTLTHAIFLRGHPEVGGKLEDDLQLLVDSGTNVAHCPVVFARGGKVLRSFQRYLTFGVNLGLGTDTVPPDMISEMRLASLLSKVVDDDRNSGSAAAVYNAATLGGARALGRDDLGRLSAGAKADIAIFNLRALHIGVVDDPIKSLIHYGSGVDTDTVIVDGRTVVEDGRVNFIKEETLLNQSQELWGPYKDKLVARDPLERSAETLFAPSFPILQSRTTRGSS